MADPTETEMMADLQAADAAGDEQLAQHIAGRIKALRQPAVPVKPQPQTTGTENIPVSLMTGDSETDKRIAESARKAGFDEKITPRVVAGSAAIMAGMAAPEVIPGIAGAAAGGALFGAGASKGRTGPEVLKDATVGAAGGALLPGAMGVIGKISPALKSLAEKAAIRSTFADRTAFRKAFGGVSDKAAQAGRFLLDEGVPLSSPRGIKAGMGDILKSEGPQIGSLTKAATDAGAKVDLGAVAQRAMQSPAVSDLATNTEGRPLFGRVQAFLEDQVQQNGNQITPAKAHSLRQTLDGLAKWDQTKPKELTDAWRAVRGALTDELGNSMEQAGLSDAWSAANKRFANASKVQSLAKVGAERREANRFVSPYEAIAGVAGGVGASMHHPGALAIPAAAWLGNRYGMPVTARAADVASKLLSSPLPTEAAQQVAPVAGSKLQTLIDAIRRRSSLSLVPTAAQENQQ